METFPHHTCLFYSVPCSTLKLYVSHLQSQHAKDPSFNILCGITDCREAFWTFSAFNSHIYRHHHSAIGILRGSEDHTVVSDNDDRETDLLHESSNSDECLDMTMDWQEEQSPESVGALICTPDNSMMLSEKERGKN